MNAKNVVTRESVQAAVWQDGKALYHVADELCDDREIVLAAVKQDGLNLKLAA